MPPARPFDEELVREIVTKALKLVADFDSDDIDGFTFERFTPYHKQVFIDAVKVFVKAVKRDDRSYYDIRLNTSDLDNKTVGEFIQYVLENRVIVPSDHSLDMDL